MHVLVRDVLARVEHGDHGAGFLDGFQALHDAVFFDDLADTRAPADAGRVDEHELLVVALDGTWMLSRVVPGSGEVIEAILAEQPIDQRRLADVRPADHGDLRAMLGLGGRVRLAVGRKRRQRREEQPVDTLAVRGRDADRRA